MRPLRSCSAETRSSGASPLKARSRAGHRLGLEKARLRVRRPGIPHRIEGRAVRVIGEVARHRSRTIELEVSGGVGGRNPTAITASSTRLSPSTPGSGAPPSASIRSSTIGPASSTTARAETSRPPRSLCRPSTSVSRMTARASGSRVSELRRSTSAPSVTTNGRPCHSSVAPLRSGLEDPRRTAPAVRDRAADILDLESAPRAHVDADVHVVTAEQHHAGRGDRDMGAHGRRARSGAVRARRPPGPRARAARLPSPRCAWRSLVRVPPRDGLRAGDVVVVVVLVSRRLLGPVGVRVDEPALRVLLIGVEMRGHRSRVLRDVGAGAMTARIVSTHARSASTEAASCRDSARTARPSRAASASATICVTSTPTYGARSVLLTTRRSARPMPGPPLRATSPPPATSRTKICASTRAGENVAVRLSPPDSMSTTSSGAKSRSRSSAASRLVVMSSRIAVCGQAPVSTARMRSGSSTPAERRNRASSSV